MENNSDPKKRLLYFDFLRIAAMMAVIMLHTSASKFFSDVNTFTFDAANFFDSITRWSVPVFTMISGALFLDNKKELSLEKLYFKNVLRIITVFLFWSIFYTIDNYFKYGDNIKGLILEIIEGHYHMWFLFMLVGLYIITPLLRKITADKKMTEYYLIISFIFTFLIPTIITGLKVIDVLLNTEGILCAFAQRVYGKVHFEFAVGYSFYYVLGYYLKNLEIGRKLKKVIYALGIFGFASTIIMTKIISNFYGTAREDFYGNLTINVALEALFVFVLAKCEIEPLINTAKKEKIILLLSKCSLAVYLVHPWILTEIGKIEIIENIPNPILLIVTKALITIIFSIIVSLILNKIPVIKKYFV